MNPTNNQQSKNTMAETGGWLSFFYQADRHLRGLIRFLSGRIGKKIIEKINFQMRCNRNYKPVGEI